MLRVIRQSSLLHYSVGLVLVCAVLLVVWPGLAENLFASERFMTRYHGYAMIGSLVNLHYYADWVIGLSYVAISLALAYLVYRARRDIPFHWVCLAFGLAIIACGGTHFMEVYTTYHKPVYWLAGYVKLITALASLATAVVLPLLIPKTLALVRTAKLSAERRAQLEAANEELSALHAKVKELDDLASRRSADATRADTLRDTSQTMQAIIQASPLGIIVLDNDGLIKLWNSAAERIYGWREQEVLGRPLPAVPVGQEEELRRNHQAAVAGRNFVNYETRRVRKDGTFVDVSISTAPLRNADGATAGVIALVTDVTERKRAEAALRRSEARNRALLDAIPDLMFRIARDGRFLDVHATRPEALQTPPAEFIGKQLADVMPPALAAAALEHIKRAVASGELQVFEYELEMQSGARSYEARIVASGEDEVTVIVRDVTRRRRRDAAQRYLADATAALVSSLDYEQTLDRVARLAVPYVADWCMVYMLDEREAIRLLAVAHTDETKARLAWEIEEEDAAAGGAVPKAIRTGQAELYPRLPEPQPDTPTHGIRRLELARQMGLRSVMIVPLVARGRTLGALTFATAESGRTYGPADLALAEELARRAALAIDNARLYQRAQEANRAKEEFLATLSHELRTPLTPIIGWVHMLSTGQADAPDVHHGLSVIDKNSQALARLINDLLDMSAILSGKMRIDRLPVTIAHVLREACETVRPEAARRGIEIELTQWPADELVAVAGDRTRLGQVFWNLIHNAVKFSDAAARVRVRGEADADEVRITVEDEGIGIAPDFMPHVFERFRQADMSTTKRHGGLGIGLALVRSFVEAHGGTVRAESAGAGRGSRFTVCLPRMALPAAPAEVAPRGTGTTAAHERPRPSRHVLLVEDAEDTLELMRRAFQVHGYRVTACTSAAEALGVAERERFDIIVSDIGLPHIDGYELLARLRRTCPALSAVPAVALTGYATAQDVTRAHAAGFAVHIAKPVDPATLARVVEQLLTRTHS